MTPYLIAAMNFPQVSHIKQLYCLSIILLSCWASISYGVTPEQITFQVNEFTIDGDLPAKEQQIQQLLTAAEGKTYSLSSLQELSKQIEQLIRDDGYSFYRVVLPPQTLAEGKVKFEVISYTLGNINISGNDYFDDRNIKRSLPYLSANKPINTHDISEALKIANHHPSKQVKLTFKQSESADKIDAEINVTDRRPYNVSLIMNNAGTKDSGYYRITAALQHNNLWDLDHSFNASYTTSPDHADSVIQYGFNYNAPIYLLKGWLSAYYVSSDIDTGIVAGGFDVSGSGEMFGINYQQYLPAIDLYEHWLSAGLDNRFFDNNIQFDFQDIGTDVRSTPFHLGYKAQYPWQSGQFGFNIQWVRNIGYGSYNSQFDYNATRLGASKDWNAIRYGFNVHHFFGQWLLQAAFSAQYSPDLLIPGEQIGLGGTYSVRGYQERETSADSGQVLHIELYTPAWHQIKALAFFDYGHGRQTDTLPGETKEWDISSLGFGARWQWSHYLYTSVDIAFALKDAPLTQPDNTKAGDHRVHASIVLRY